MQFTQNYLDGFLATWAGCPALRNFRPERWLEVGTFEGRSACWMIENKLAEEGQIVCIDTFDLFPDQEGITTCNLLEAAYPKDVLTFPHRGTLPEIAPRLSGHFDGCYIDGPKEYESCLEASRLAWDLVRPGGVLIWDDIYWDESRHVHDRDQLGPVGLAVKQLLEEHGISWRRLDWPRRGEWGTQAAIVKPGQASSRCVVDVAFGEVFCHEARATEENHRLYAESVGADYIRIRDPVSALPYGCAAKLAILPLLEKYEQTLYLDLDVVCTRIAPDIFAEVPAGYWGAIDETGCVQNSRDHQQAEADTILYQAHAAGMRLPWAINGGVLLIPQGGQTILEPPAQKMPNSWTLDQMWISVQLARYNVPFVRLDRRWNWTFWMHEGKSERTYERAFFIHHNHADRATRWQDLEQLVAQYGFTTETTEKGE